MARVPARFASTPAGPHRLHVLGAAVAIALSVLATDASALALGRLNVQSALGEPLRAEIEITEMSAAEAEGLKVNVASAEAFRMAGVPYNAALSDVRATVQRRADGRYVVRVAGSRMLNDPFVDLLLEANWNTGRIVRDYTVLLDPPANRQAAAPAVVAPQISAPVAPRPSPPVTQAPIRRERPAAPAPVPAQAAVRADGSGEQVAVQRGDTASKIAAAHKPAEVSLDQMLVALLRANPDAFIGGNINRMKAGAVLELPAAAQASAVLASDARRILTAQSRDFSGYRQRLAENAPTSNVPAADRRASGKLQGSVEDRNAAATSPDKLTISQGGASARAAEDALAQSRQAKESSNRAAEISKNITELNKLQAAAGAGPTAAPATPAAAASTATPPVTAPAAVPATTAPAAGATTAAAAGATAAAAASGLTVPGSTPVAGAPAADTAPVAASTPPAAPPAVATPAPAQAPAEGGFFADLLDNPLILAGAALLALLVAFLLYRVLGRRRREDAGESVFLESRLPKDSFFGASGGESVDTKNRSNSGMSSLSYSPSQLDAGDVDPVAEADVYLAYGRDLQAEEILREALRMTPERTAIHVKLLEIHAKRRDLRAYQALATDVQKLTGGTGSDWNHVTEMGKDLDPGNPLYDSTIGKSVTEAETTAFAGALAAATAVQPPAPATPPPPAFVPSVAPLDFDLELTKPPTAERAPVAAPVSASLPPAAPAVAAPAEDPYPRTMPYAPATRPMLPPDLENDFDTAPGALEPVTTRGVPLSMPSAERTQPATLRAGLPGDSGFIEFDMSALAGLPPRSPADTVPGRLDALAEGDAESPNAVKLSLARELQALGDIEGARSLVEEVEAESTGDVQAQARQLLAQLN